MQRIDRRLKAEARQDQPVIDTVTLTWDGRQKSRQRLRTAQGQELALALPTGTRLQAGDLLPTADGYIEEVSAMWSGERLAREEDAVVRGGVRLGGHRQVAALGSTAV